MSPAGVDEIRAWYEAQPTKVQAKFFSRVKTLAQLDLPEWRLPLFCWLHGDCHPLGEIRFKALGVQFRPLGFRGPGPRTFTLTYPATEQSDRFVPQNACALALSKKLEIENDKNRSCPIWLKLE